MSEDILHRRENDGHDIIDYDMIYGEALRLIDDTVYSISGLYYIVSNVTSPYTTFFSTIFCFF